MKYMVNIYVTLIHAGIRVLEQVPIIIREDVRKALEESEELGL